MAQSALLRTLIRGLPIIICTTTAGILIAKKYLQYATPMYESTAKIKLADPHDGVSNNNLYKDFDVFTSTNKIGAEVELVKSKALVAKAIGKLDISTSIYRVGDLHKTELYRESPFLLRAEINNEKWYGKSFAITISSDSLVSVVAPDGKSLNGKFSQVLRCEGAALLFSRNEEILRSRPRLPVNDRYEAVIVSRERLINSIVDKLDVMAVDKDVPVLRISYTSPVPQKAADVVNTLAAAYISDYIDEKFRTADTTADFLNRELRDYSSKLSSSESAIETYRDKHDIINIHQETETDLRKIADLKKQAASLKMNLTAIDSLNNYVQAGKDNFLELAPNFEAFTDLLSTELVKKTKELQREKQDLLLRYTAENEKVQVVDAKLADINAYLVESIGNTRKSLQNQYNNLCRSIGDAESVFVGLPTREKSMTILERNFGLNEQIYRFLSEKKTEAEIARAATISFHRIISPAEVPVKPVSPNAPIIRILAAILGLMAGVGFVTGVHAIKGRVGNEDTIARASSLPIAMQVPYCRDAIQKQFYFRKAAVQLELKGHLAKGSVLVVSSYERGEGADFVAAQLAAAIGTLDKRVRLVDYAELSPAQLRNPEEFRLFAEHEAASCDVLILANAPLTEHPSAMVPMAVATLNLIVLDARRTRKARIVETDLMASEFQLKTTQFVLNRAGYTPSLLTQLRQRLRWVLNKIRR